MSSKKSCVEAPKSLKMWPFLGTVACDVNTISVSSERLSRDSNGALQNRGAQGEKNTKEDVSALLLSRWRQLSERTRESAKFEWENIKI